MAYKLPERCTTIWGKAMLSVKQVAEQLAVSPTCVYQLIAAGKLACHRIGIGRGAIRVCESDLAMFLASCRAEETLPPKVQPSRGKRPEFKHLRLDTGES